MTDRPPRVATLDTPIARNRDPATGQAPGPWLQKILLSFDGGGVRGYWSLLVLQHLMQVIRDIEVNHDGATKSSFHPCQRPENVSHLTNQDNLDNPTEYTPFLPCHYFDYIGGTSTGALVAILLSRFRMTVEDCLREYETMAGTIFGSPRIVHKMRVPVMKRNKYDVKHLEQAIQQVIERRAQLRIEDDTEPLFQTEIDTCRGVVLATKLDFGGLEKRFLFRSYTPYSEKRRRNIQNGLNSENLFLKNPGEGIRNSLLKVALAGTAAPFYFGHYHTVLSTVQAQAAMRVPTNNNTNFFRIATGRPEDNSIHVPGDKSKYRFEDAGFSRDNNPCQELYQEIRYHHGDETPIILVSVGTARPREAFLGDGALSHIRRGLQRLGNPEEVHEHLEANKDSGQYSYYRLNDEAGINIEMDEWKPRKVGKDTIVKMEAEFRSWLQRDGVEDKFRECARHLVHLRRVRMTTPRWERFALGQYFVCQVQHCPKDRDNSWLDKADFENHLRREHAEEDYEDLDTALENCRQVWRYRPRPASPRSDGN
ncbi:acyl transferase/acyl hydrolase/lysophospholipase [Xylaria telfairii]|nr:acyl transferase/acyl hydrolase/lysophospholipase [Xylaria telfairii]